MRDESQPSAVATGARTASGREKRRHDRYPAKIPASLVSGKTVIQSLVTDVSFGGLFFGTDAPPRLRNLVRLKLELPSDKKPIELLGMAVYVSVPGAPGGRPPGVGIQFFGIDEATRERWEKFIVQARSEREAPATAPAPRAPSVRPAIVPELRLNAPSVEALAAAVFRADDATMRMRAQVALPIGAPIRIILVHPSSARQLALPATVRGRNAEHLLVRLDAREERRAEIERFLRDQEHITMDLDITIDEL